MIFEDRPDTVNQFRSPEQLTIRSRRDDHVLSYSIDGHLVSPPHDLYRQAIPKCWCSFDYRKYTVVSSYRWGDSHLRRSIEEVAIRGDSPDSHPMNAP